MPNIIETKNLVKKFGRFTAVDKISISVGKGEIYGFLGLNGAGKTTTIRMLLGMIGPSSGEILLDGKRVRAGGLELWRRVGYLVEIPYSYPDLTVRENLEIVRRLRLISDPQTVDAVMERLTISHYADRIARNLSLGNAQRLGLAKALIHEPSILILDEPANGLDPAGIVEIRKLLTDLSHNRGTTVFVSSHILGEVAKFATRIGIIHEGKLLQEMDTAHLETVRNRRLLVCVRDAEAARVTLERNGLAVSAAQQGLLTIADPAAINNPENINELLVGAGCAPSMIRVDEEDLETYFLRVIGGKGGAA